MMTNRVRAVVRVRTRARVMARARARVRVRGRVRIRVWLVGRRATTIHVSERRVNLGIYVRVSQYR